MAKRKTKSDRISISTAVEQFTCSVKQVFTPEEVVHYAKTFVGGSVREIAGQAEAFLQQDLSSFYDPSTDLYVPRRLYFQGARFRIVPQEEEIQENILIPGHRFIPFCDSRVFPPDCTLRLADGLQVPRRKIRRPLETVLIYFTFLGIPGMVDYLVSDEESNAHSLREDRPDAPVALTVFDMTAAYAGCNFRPGDSFILTTEDWAQGHFSLAYSPAQEARSLWKSAGRKWCKSLEDALEDVFDDLGPLASIDEQLAQAFFRGGPALLENPCTHIGGFLKRSKRVQISQAGVATVLWRGGESPADHLTFPADLGDALMQGHAGSLDSILQDIGVLAPV